MRRDEQDFVALQFMEQFVAGCIRSEVDSRPCNLLALCKVARLVFIGIPDNSHGPIFFAGPFNDGLLVLQPFQTTQYKDALALRIVRRSEKLRCDAQWNGPLVFDCAEISLYALGFAL